MWVFLVTEILFFGGALMAYMVYRMLVSGRVRRRPAATSRPARRHQHRGAHPQLADDGAGGARGADRRTTKIMFFIAITMVLGAAFLGIKGYEYHEKFEEHSFPASV